MSFLVLLFYAHLISSSLAIPRRHASAFSRNEMSTPSGLNATVTDHAGRDITSFFKVMLYQEPQIAASKNLSNRNDPMYSRRMNNCHGHGGNVFFVSSECRPEPGQPGSIRAYRTFCHRVIEDYDPWTGESNGSFAEVPSYRYGHCRHDEICVNSPTTLASLSAHRVAKCVSTAYFVRMIEYDPNRGNKSRLKTGLEGSVASMMISKPDGNTPVEADTFSMEAIFAMDDLDMDAEGLATTHKGQSKCRDCVELETQQFEKGAEGLRAQATLLTTGAMAGILWLAVLSG